ncbi:MAG TPA: alkaline phosphatase family protein [Candidatus Sulfopaludibacter sp.]|nr:alkaline phosphatase family protein [Candidatus Sulfopaludibacter sp.]
MFFGANSGRPVYPGNSARWCVFLFLLALHAFPIAGRALPQRLVLGLDGIAYRDMEALQRGVICTNIRGRPFRRQAFSAGEGYFPVSRLVSTFPSTSDVAWTDIFGDRPLPGYQRTYFSAAANSQIVINGITTTMEHESQMHWQLENNMFRTMGYVYPMHTCELEIHEALRAFWNDTDNHGSYYVYIRATDDAQHLDRDVFDMLCGLDDQLQALRARYRNQTGRDLQILILSDHGHNHASSFRRVEVRSLLAKAGYRITESLQNPRDVVLPTTGIEDWVEIHNAPAETETLMSLLTHLPGADLVTGRDPSDPHRFLVMNPRGDRADIDWNPTNNAYRYRARQGDPLHYLPVIETLTRSQLMDPDGFAAADAWMAATLTNHYPLALERIARGLTRVTLNPATILISLDNGYVHSGWLIQKGADLSTFSSTHGALDNLNSDGIVLSNFTPTRDTSSDRVAGLFDNFSDVRNFRADENGAELVTRNEQALARIAHDPFDSDYRELSGKEVYLRVWSPQLARLDIHTPVQVTIEKVNHFPKAQNPRRVPGPDAALGRRLAFNQPVSFSDPPACERVYALPSDLILKPLTEYLISGWIRGQSKSLSLFEFNFYTDRRGRPAAY